MTNTDYEVVWRAAAAFRSAGDLCPEALGTLGLIAASDCVPVDATLAEARAELRARGLADAGWRWLIRHGTAGMIRHLPLDPDQALDWIVALASCLAGAGIGLPAPRLLRLLGRGWCTAPIGTAGAPPSWLVGALDAMLAAVDDGARDWPDQQIVDVLRWFRARRPEFHANQRRAGWPAVYRAYCDAPDGLRQKLEPIRSPVPFRERIVAGKRVICLGNAWELWQEGAAMGHCTSPLTKADPRVLS